MVTITVRGSAQREVKPELARALLGVEMTGASRAEVWEKALTAHAKLAGRAADLVAQGKAVDWTALEVQVGSYYDWVPMVGNPGQSEQVRRYRAAGDVTVEFADFQELGQWLASIAESTGVEVRGVNWSLTDNTRQTIAREVRSEAVLDAKQRAEDYARDIGTPDITITALYEPGLYPGPDAATGGLSPAMPRAMMMAERSVTSQSIELKPAIIPVGAEVIAVFNTNRPKENRRQTGLSV